MIALARRRGLGIALLLWVLIVAGATLRLGRRTSIIFEALPLLDYIRFGLLDSSEHLAVRFDIRILLVSK